MSKLISYEMATHLLLNNLPARQTELLPAKAALGRVLAAEVVADQDIPPFHKAVMDGYAVRSRDISGPSSRLQIVGEIPAGQPSGVRIGPGQAAAIMTGAPLPCGADTVVMVEKTECHGESTILIQADVKGGENVAAKGSEVKKGATVLRYEEPIRAAHLGVLAMFGRVSLEVFSAPKIVILPTGNEIVELEQTPSRGQIRNSNATMLAAQCQRLGAVAKPVSIVGDEADKLGKAIQGGLALADILLLTGGVSMGKHDLVPEVLRAEGVDIIFHKAAIKPGKPVLLGRVGSKLIFGLPGNPVSSFVTFELFVRPAIRHWMGYREIFLAEARARLEHTLRDGGDRTFFAPGLAAFSDKEMSVKPVKTAGSADIVAFASANCLIVVPAMCGELKPNQQVRILLLENLLDGKTADDT